MNSKEEDISIAHRLPSNSERKPILAKFVRRVTKLDFTKNKRNLAQLETYKNVKLFEELSKARVYFINLMKADDRINSVWSREGTLFYEWKNENLTYKTHGLYEGGIDINHSIESVLNCYNSFFQHHGQISIITLFISQLFHTTNRKPNIIQRCPQIVQTSVFLIKVLEKDFLFVPNTEGSIIKSNKKTMNILNVNVRSLRKN